MLEEPRLDILSAGQPQWLPRIPGAEPEELELRADREFEFRLETQHLHVTGYSVEEVADLLRLYREHMELIAAFAQQQQGLGDAYRSGPVQP